MELLLKISRAHVYLELSISVHSQIVFIHIVSTASRNEGKEM